MAAGPDGARRVGPAGEIPRIEAAETEFVQALQAFERGDYGLAYRQFRRVIDAYPAHRRTTAAWIMAAKALYRMGEYDHVIRWADEFMARYPTSRYRSEAERLRHLPRQHCIGANRRLA